MNKNAKIVKLNAVDVHNMMFAQDALIQLIMSFQMGNALKNVILDSIFQIKFV